MHPAIENDIPTTSFNDMNDASPTASDRPHAPTILDEKGVPLSKNKQKKLKKEQEWEAKRDIRKAKRKEKDQEKKERKRAAAATAATAAAAAAAGVREEGGEPEAKKARLDSDVGKQSTKALSDSGGRARPRHPQFVQLPVTLVLDCGFDDLMNDLEIKSLSSQVTRAYSDCHRAPYQAKMMVCSFGGRLRERFEGVLTSNHKSWRGVTFLKEDFVVAAERARELMGNDAGPSGGKMVAAFAKYADEGEGSERARLREEGEVVYLTSDSDTTLSELKPYSTYIIGGIVDKNRHKGICYKRAMDKRVRTAKLPIAEYMRMQSRFVLATNHVVEIMLRWLECGNWGEAFMKVIPKRKGGSLRVDSGDDHCGKEDASMGEKRHGDPEGEMVDTQKEYQDAVDKNEERETREKECFQLLDQPAQPESSEGEKIGNAATMTTDTIAQADSQPTEETKVISSAGASQARSTAFEKL